MLWDSTSHVAPHSYTSCVHGQYLLFLRMPKTTRSLSAVPPDISQYLIARLARLPAEVLRLHLSSQQLVTSGSKVVMAKRLHDALHAHGAIDATSLLSLPTVTATSTETVTATSTADLFAALPPALQAQLSTIVAQFLQHATLNATPPGTPPPSTIQPVNPPVTLPPATEAQLASLPSLTTQFPQHTADNLSPVSLINAPSQQLPAPLSSQQVLSSQPTLCSQPMLPSQLPLTSQPMLPNQLPLTSQPLLMTATTTVPAVRSYLLVVQPTATHAATFVPPPATRTTIGTITQSAGYLMETQPSYQMISNTIPPVPAQIRQRITQGEFID